MADLDLKLDGIANGVLVEQTDKKKANADKKKRMYARAFAYIRNQTGMNKRITLLPVQVVLTLLVVAIDF